MDNIEKEKNILKYSFFELNIVFIDISPPLKLEKIYSISAQCKCQHNIKVGKSQIKKDIMLCNCFQSNHSIHYQIFEYKFLMLHKEIQNYEVTR